MSATGQVGKDWKFSDRFIPAIKAIVGPYLLTPAPLAIDRTEATDLVMMSARNISVACRIRRAAYASKFPGQFTLRSGRANGVTTEFAKIASGYADVLLYGYEVPGTLAIDPWYLIDLRAFRRHLIMSPETIVQGECANIDGSSFRWYRIDSFPPKPPIVIARSENPHKPYSEMRKIA